MSPVTDVAVRTVDAPIELDLGGLYGRIDAIRYVVVTLTDAAGNVGQGSTFSAIPSEVDAIVAAIGLLEPVLRAGDATPGDDIWHRLRAAVAGVERTAASPAVSAVDIALWDLHGVREGAPVHELLGAGVSSLPVYASDDMWATWADDVVAANARRFVDAGFGAVKIRAGGSPDPQAEAARVAAVRQAVGPDVAIMVDALQVYDEATAVAIARAIGEHGVTWFEDPVSEDDIDACARVAAAVDVPIATGEDACWPEGLMALLDAGAVDVLMADVKWVGGITPFVAVGGLAAERGVPIVSHISPELTAPALAACPTAMMLEWFSWSFPLYATAPTATDGRYTLPTTPGLGLTYR